MKKGFLLFSALFLIAASGVFAAVSVKQEGDVVKVTWTYTAPDASFVGLVGDFQGWNLGGAVPMTKDANGVWSITLDSTPTGEFTYKFNVDDEWTEDPQAPAGVDDGFGGTNGKVYVADLLAAASGAPVAAASGGGRIAFGTYTEASVAATFLTQDVKTNTEKGFDLDAVNVALKSYWKVSGPALPYVDFFMEVAVVDEGNIKLYKANTLAGEVPLTTWGDGLENLSKVLFAPLYAFNGKDSMLGHFKATLKTPFVNILTAQKYAKGTIRDETYIHTYIQEADSGQGLVEFTNGAPIDLGGMNLKYLFGPNYIKNTAGVYSFAEVSSDAFDVAIQYNARTLQKDSLFLYWDESVHLTGLSARLKGISPLSLTFDSFANFWTGEKHAEKTVIDGLAATLKVGYADPMFGATLTAGYYGDNIDTIFGNDDGLNKGKLFVGLSPYVNAAEGIKIGLDADVKLDNMTSENETTPGIETYYKPYVDVSLSGLGLSLYGKMNFNQISESDDEDMPWAFKLNEVGAKFSMTDLTAYLAYTVNNGSWGTHDLSDGTEGTENSFKAEGFDLSALLSYTLAKDMNLYLGGIYRAQGANESNADYKKENPIGATVGWDFLLPMPEIRLPKIFAVFNYNFDPYDGGKPGYKLSDFRADQLGGSANGIATMRAGIVWSF